MEQLTLEKHDIRLIALDVDGTLLNSKHELSARNERALRAAMDEGVQVVLATGKSRTALAFVIERLKLTSPGIFVQGTMIYDGDGSIRHQVTLDPAITRRVITFAEDRGFWVGLYSGSRILVRRINDDVVDKLVAYHEPMPEAVGPLQNQLDAHPVHKIMIAGEPRAIKALRWQFNAQLGSTAQLMEVGVPGVLDILPPGASKGSALKVLLRQMKVDRANVLAVGDGENDVEMLTTAGLGVAVANAGEHVKAAAKHIVASNDNDGVAEAIESLVLGHKVEAPAQAASVEPAGKAPEAIEAETDVRSEEPERAASGEEQR